VSLLRNPYFTLINPYFEYCNAIWAISSSIALVKLFRIQKSTICLIANSEWNAHRPTAPLFRDLNILTIHQLNLLHVALFCNFWVCIVYFYFCHCCCNKQLSTNNTHRRVVRMLLLYAYNITIPSRPTNSRTKIKAMSTVLQLLSLCRGNVLPQLLGQRATHLGLWAAERKSEWPTLK